MGHLCPRAHNAHTTDKYKNKKPKRSIFRQKNHPPLREEWSANGHMRVIGVVSTIIKPIRPYEPIAPISPIIPMAFVKAVIFEHAKI